MDSTFVIAQVSSTTDSISDAMVGYLPVILVVVAALIGLGIGLKYVKKWIGRKA